MSGVFFLLDMGNVYYSFMPGFIGVNFFRLMTSCLELELRKSQAFSEFIPIALGNFVL